jgi:subtilisin-like proprotein convertase family protein
MKKNTKSLLFALSMICMAALSLWYVASINKTQAQAEQSDKNEVIATPAATFAGTGTGPIPDGPSVGCGDYTGTPLNVTFNVTGLSGAVSNVAVQFNASHTWVGDLRVILIAPGGSPSHTLFSQTGATSSTGCGNSADLSSSNTYRFADSGTSPNWWTTVFNTGVGTVPAGTYQATQPAPQSASSFSPTTSINSAFSSVTNPNGTWTLRFLDGGGGDTGSVTGATLDIQTAAVSKPCFDFYGTGRTSFGILNGEGNVIVWRTRSNGGTSSEDIGYGISTTDFLTPGYYDGDNKADIAVWRNGTYFVRRSTTGNPQNISPQPWGLGTDSPGLEADYDGDGRDDFTVVRDNGTNYVWYILRSSTNTFSQVTFGLSSTDTPIAGADYNGDGKADLVVLRGSTSTSYYVGDATTGSLILVQQWGNYSTDFYVVGDFLGDGRADFAVWRGLGSGTNGNWYIKENGGPGVVIANFGIPGSSSVRDQALCGDFNGDGKSDIAVYRPSNKTFYWATNPNNPSAFQSYTMTFPSGTAPISGEFAIPSFRAF